MQTDEKQFYVLLAVFGAIFALGLNLIHDAKGSESLLVGLGVTVFGLVGLLMLSDRVRLWAAARFRFRIPFPFLSVIGVWIIIAIFVSYIHGLRSDLDAYAMPRVISKSQAHGLANYLSKHEPHSVTMKADPKDPEAMEYTSELLNAIKDGGWEVAFDTSTPQGGPNEPTTFNPGLCSWVVGSSIDPPDPQHDPRPLLQDALQSVHIDLKCSGGGAWGSQYKLFLVVGKRPTTIGNQHNSILERVGRWLLNI